MPPPVSSATQRVAVSGAEPETMHTIQSLDPASREGLEATFELFNRMSENLEDSYRALENRVSVLTHELNRVNEQREEEIKSREQVTSRLSNLLDLLPGGVVVLDRWGAVSQVNPAANELLGIPLMGKKWLDVIAECFAPRKDDWHEISLKNGKRVSLSTRSLEQETGQIILLTDQTETRQLQEQVSRNERLSALGRMVSALAHQIRTPLSTAILYAGHLTEKELSATQVQKFSAKVLSRLNHLEQQVRDMLFFVKGNIPLNDNVFVKEIIMDALQSVDAAVKAGHVELLVENHCEEAKLHCNQQALVGAITNVLNNAIQASQAQGTITLKAMQEQAQLILLVEDQGCGIADNVLQRIQDEEAFVTTKEQGTGLGLSIVRSVIKAHKGQFTLRASESGGALAAVVLPLI